MCPQKENRDLKAIPVYLGPALQRLHVVERCFKCPAVNWRLKGGAHPTPSEDSVAEFELGTKRQDAVVLLLTSQAIGKESREMF